jgi:hypothetical protein
MGFLDDAIREHLDLKRRRGADPTELERLEREALGPVRRPQADVLDAPAVDEPRAGVYAEDELEEDWSEARQERPFADHGAEFAEEDEFEDWDAPVERAERGPIESAIEEMPEADLPPARRPPPPAPAEQAPPSDADPHSLEQETVEHDVAAEELEHDDDMLEETPEFLQDTPDHDRLWFEQRPPRDFDFDG